MSYNAIVMIMVMFVCCSGLTICKLDYLKNVNKAYTANDEKRLP